MTIAMGKPGLTYPMPAFASGLCRHYRRRLERRARDIPAHWLDRPTVVFAPHHDDETLGCGGTIRRLRAQGTPVTIVFMTDGSQAHGAGAAGADLAAQRRDEGYAAAALLGVDAERVHALDYPDGALRDHAASAESRVAEILAASGAVNVYAPFERDTTPDHIATHLIVKHAVQRCGAALDLWAYPVWFWYYWPWSPWNEKPDRSWRWRLRRALQSHRHARRWCRWRVDITAQRPDKLAALLAHESQTRRKAGDAAWPTLGDVWNGNFLACFFGKYELFAHVLGPDSRR